MNCSFANIKKKKKGFDSSSSRTANPTWNITGSCVLEGRKTFLGTFPAACVSELYILVQTDGIFCIGEVKPVFLKNLRTASNYRWLYQLITPGCPGVQVSATATCFQPQCLCEAQTWRFGTAVPVTCSPRAKWRHQILTKRGNNFHLGYVRASACPSEASRC